LINRRTAAKRCSQKQKPEKRSKTAFKALELYKEKKLQWQKILS